MEAAGTCDTFVNFCQTNGATTQKTAILIIIKVVYSVTAENLMVYIPIQSKNVNITGTTEELISLLVEVTKRARPT
jgi:hypothetical protein